MKSSFNLWSIVLCMFVFKMLLEKYVKIKFTYAREIHSYDYISHQDLLYLPLTKTSKWQSSLMVLAYFINFLYQQIPNLRSSKPKLSAVLNAKYVYNNTYFNFVPFLLIVAVQIKNPFLLKS